MSKGKKRPRKGTPILDPRGKDIPIASSWVIRFDDGDQMNCTLQRGTYGAKSKWVFVEDRDAMRALSTQLKV
jgi:hypothetical protein